MKKIIHYLYNKTTFGKHHIGFVRFLIRLSANLLVFPLSWCKPQIKSGEPQVIISLTSFPARIKNLWKIIIPLLHQHTSISYRIILWLSKEQFAGLDSLPAKLEKLTKYNLEIRLMEDDLKSHKKYYYAFKEYSDKIIITVDDDILYSLDLIEKLYIAHLQAPDVVCCCRGREVSFDKEGLPLKYKRWKIIASAQSDSRSYLIIPTGIGGVLYPPFCYSEKIFDIEVFKATCLGGDDLWLNFMCRQKHTCVKHITNKFRYNTLFFSQKTSLSKINVKKEKNDEQIELLSQWARKECGCNFFYKMPSQ